MIRVVLADDHAIVRQGIAKLLADERDIRVVGEAATATELLTVLEATPTDVLILDVSMPGPGIVEMLKTVRANHPRTRVIVLSMFPEAQYATRTLRNGASGYLTKDQSPELLVSAIRKVAGGGRFVTPSLAEHLASELDRDDLRPPHETLSDREFDVLRWIGDGLSIKQIAARLQLSSKTVSTYRARVMVKLQLRTNADLVRYVLEHKIDRQ